MRLLRLGLCLLMGLLPTLAAPPLTLRYWIAPCPAEEDSGCRSGDAELARWALEAWQTASHSQLKLQSTPDERQAHIRLRWVGARSGVFGEARAFRDGNIIGYDVFVRPALDQLGDTVSVAGANDRLYRDAVVYLTCLHETGHALNLRHTSAFADIMYSFGYGGDIGLYFRRYRDKLRNRTDIPQHSGLSPQDITALQAALQNGQ